MKEQKIIENIIKHFVSSLSVQETVEEFTTVLKRYRTPIIRVAKPDMCTLEFDNKTDLLFDIINGVFKVNQVKIKRKSKKASDGTIFARHAFVYIAHNHLHRSKSSIARMLNRNHATIIRSLKTCNDLMETDWEFEMKLGKCITKLIQQNNGNN